MELSTSLNVYGSVGKRAGKADYKLYCDILKRASDCGFKCFDFNPSDYKSYESFYSDENWRENIKKIKEYADSIGVEFTQSHAYMFLLPEPQDMDFQMRKSIEAASIAGVPWVVIHPWVTGLSEPKEIMAENIKRFEPYIEYAKSLGVGIAIENVPKRIYWFGEEIEQEMFFYADHLIELVDNLNEKYGNVGICWDTGHAFLSMKSQYDDIVKLGSRLKVLHIADNDSQYDDHTAPFMGYIDWAEIKKALCDIDYKGTFNFEVHNYTRGLPDELLDDGVKMLYKIGDYIIKKL